MFILLRRLAVCGIVFAQSFAFAGAVEDPAQIIDPQVEIERIAVPVSQEEVAAVGTAYNSADTTFASWTMFAFVGKMLWDLVGKSGSASKIDYPVAHLLPLGSSEWTKLSGWKTADAYIYHISYKNMFGVRIADYRFRVMYNYDGQKDGKGRYLSNVSVSPGNIDLGWGYGLESQASVQEVFNAGTDQDPIAALNIMVFWKVRSLLRELGDSLVLTIKGTGEITSNKKNAH